MIHIFGGFEFIELVLNQLIFSMYDEVLLFFLLGVESFFKDIGELSLKELVGVHFFKFFEFVLREGFKAIVVVPDKLLDFAEGSLFQLLILLNDAQSERTFEDADFVLIVLEGVVDGVGLCELNRVD